MRICRECEEEKKEERFVSRHGVYENLCLKCQARRVRHSQRKDRVFCVESYGGECVCCGENNLEFLCIDHINGGGNKHRKKVGHGGTFYRWLRKNNMPEGYRVLCHNCNQSIGYYGYCPHGNLPEDNGRRIKWPSDMMGLSKDLWRSSPMNRFTFRSLINAITRLSILLSM